MLQAEGQQLGLGRAMGVWDNGTMGQWVEVRGPTVNTGALSMWGSSVDGGGRRGHGRGGCSTGGGGLGGSSNKGGDIWMGCTGGEGNGTGACVVEGLEGAGGSWEAMLLAAWLSITRKVNYSDVSKTPSNFYYLEITPKLLQNIPEVLRKCFLELV